MKLDYIKEKKELTSVALSCISLLFAVLICMKVISYFKLSARAQNIEDIVQTVMAKDTNKPDDLDKYLSSTKEMTNNLKKNNLFAPPQPKRNPVTEIPCILGDEVFINNKWYKEGEMVQDAKIVAIEPTQVTIEWDGKTTVLRPLDAATASPEPVGRPPSGPGSPQPPGPGVVAIATPSPGQSPPEEGSIPTAGPSIVPNMQFPQGLPPELAEKMKGEMQNIMPMIQNMSSEEIEEARKKIEAQFMQGGKASSQ